MTKQIIGLTENVKIFGKSQKKAIVARIDTGATMGSIDVKLASELKLGPIIKNKKVKSAAGNNLRPVIKVRLEMCGKIINKEFTIADRSHMKYRMLIGQNILRRGFLIDPSQK